MNIVALLNMKGGVGKTTTTVNLGGGLARLGRRVLLVDLDAQANLTKWLGTDDPPRAVLADALNDLSLVPLAIGPSCEPTVDLLYGSRATAVTEQQMVGDRNPSTVLRRALRRLTDYDVVLLDCPPGLGLITINAIAAANEIIIPVQTQTMALSGIELLVQTIQDLLDADVIAEVPLLRAIATMHDTRTALARSVADQLGTIDSIPLLATIRTNIQLAECFSFKKSIFDYAPRASGADDYAVLAREFLATAGAV
jgi:chromosome partitioning protein